jgi:hypothetical protein|tara:strand:- start:880 stop:1173 length:294 start_codon:yes stop_codon:yes gene_type:complete
MKIIILNSNYFVKYKGNIGMVFPPSLDLTPDSKKVLINISNEWVSVNRKSISSPTMDELNEALYQDEALKSIADEHEFISISYQEAMAFLDYSSTYN